MRPLLCLLLVPAFLHAAAPPARLTEMQGKLQLVAAFLIRAAQTQWDAFKEEEAITSMGQALAVVEDVYGRVSAAGLGARRQLAGWQGQRGRWSEAAEHQKRIWGVLSALRGPDDWRARDAYRDWREAGSQAGRTLRQRETLRQARAIHADATARLRKGEVGKALHGMRLVAEAYKEVLGEGHHDYATALNDLAVLLQDSGDLEAALPVARRALDIRVKALGGVHPQVAQSLNTLANVSRAMGDHALALRPAEVALAIAWATLGTQDPVSAVYLSNLGTLRKEIGDFRSALPLLRRAHDVLVEAGDGWLLEYASCLNNLGEVYLCLGDHRTALGLLRDALNRLKTFGGEKGPTYATALNNLAALHRDLGDLKGALPLYEKALALFKEAHGEKHPTYLTALNNLGELLMSAGSREAARLALRKALTLKKEALGEKHASYAATLANLSWLGIEEGDLKTALVYGRRAQAVYREALGENHPHSAAALHALANLHVLAGEAWRALSPSRRALETALAHLEDSAAVQSDRQQLLAAAAFRGHLDLRLSVPDDAGAYSWTPLLAWKGSLLLRQQQLRLTLRLSAHPAAAAAAGRLQTVTRHLAALRLSPAATRERLEALRVEQEEAQAALSRLSADFLNHRARERPTPEAVVRSVPADAVLVDFLFYRRLVLGGFAGRPMFQRQLVAFVTRGGRKPARVDLGPAGPIEEAAEVWRRDLIRRRPGERESARSLHRLLWAPLEKHVEGAKVVLVSPDGVLGTVPFCALPGKKEGAFLIEDAPVAVIPVPRSLPALLRPSAAAGRLKPSLLTVGGLRYDPPAGAAAPRADAAARLPPRDAREEFAELEGTGPEADAVRASFRRLFPAGTGPDLRGGRATKAAVRKALSSVRYAHLATHGYFAPEKIRSAFDDAEGARPGREPRVIGWHPLLLSGLALSDANREPKEGEEGGILTALEVSEWDLSKLELAVLSACETGLGVVAGGEGLLGMQRAFQAAGCRSVIASLWKVDDDATLWLMSRLYTAAWDTREPAGMAEALRRAQLAMLREARAGREPYRAAPYFWAGFVLSGDWR